MQYFNIQVASQLSGVASATIRAWEKRYNAVVPERAENKHRLYSETDIEKLAILYRLTEFGQSIGKIAHLELNELKNVYTTLLHRPYDEKDLVTPNHDRVNTHQIIDNIFLALHSFKTDIITHELEKARLQLNTKEFCKGIVLPIYQKLRNQEQNSKIKTTQVNILKSILLTEVGLLINHHYQMPIQKSGLILIATDDDDQIISACCSLILIHFGIRFIYLAKNLHINDLVWTANTLNATCILFHLKWANSIEKLISLKQELKGKTELYIYGDKGSEISSEIEKQNFNYLPNLETLENYLENF